MIKRVKITNFQSHKDTTILPSPGINVIVGRNMQGKSALLRAIRLLLFNKPDGDKFVTWGEKNAEIEIEYNDHVIRRVKGKQNIYELDNSQFVSFGKNIPPEILSILGFSVLQVESKTYELNMEGPHEPPFLVSESDTTKGRVFSSLGERLVGDLVLLDKTISQSNSSLTKMKTESKVVKIDIEKLQEELVVFTPLDGINELISQGQSKVDGAKSITTSISNCSELLYSINTIESSVATVKETLEAYDFTTIDESLERANTLSKEISELSTSKSQIESATSTINTCNRVISTLSDTPDKELATISLLSDELNILIPLGEKIFRGTNEITSTKSRIKAHSRALEALLEEYRQVLTDAKKCPTCFRDVTDEDLKTIIEELTNDS